MASAMLRAARAGASLFARGTKEATHQATRRAGFSLSRPFVGTSGLQQHQVYKGGAKLRVFDVGPPQAAPAIRCEGSVAAVSVLRTIQGLDYTGSALFAFTGSLKVRLVPSLSFLRGPGPRSAARD